MSYIKRFREDLNKRVLSSKDDWDKEWERAETAMLRRFDVWRSADNPVILSIEFGRESPHFVYLQALVADA